MDNIHQHNYQQALDSHNHALGMTPAHRAMLRSAAGPQASAAFTVLPTQPMWRMTDRTLMYATRLRLHLPAHHLLPSICAMCHTESASEDARIAHAQTCSKLSRKEATARHDAVLHSLLADARRAGMLTIKEPTVCNEQDRLKPDARVIPVVPTARSVYIDVSLCHAAANSYVSKHRTDLHSMRSAKRREAQKYSKYQADADADGCDLVPFVLESSGALGASALRFVHWLAQQLVLSVPGTSYQRERHRLLTGVAMAVQRGNAMMSERAVQAASAQLAAPARIRKRARYGWPRPKYPVDWEGGAREDTESTGLPAMGG